MKTHNFNDSIKHGKAGEKIIAELVTTFPLVTKYEDVSENPAFQQKDIDGILWLRNGTYTTAEIKTDSYRSGNFFYETKSCVETNTIGCMERTDATHLYYYFTGYKKCYVINMKQYRKWALAEHIAHPDVFQDKLLKNVSKSQKSTHHSAGFIIPIAYFENHFPKTFWKVYDMSKWQDIPA